MDDDDHRDWCSGMVRRHFQYTRSQKADDVLRKWDSRGAPKFVKVYPEGLQARPSQNERVDAESGNG